MFVSALYSYYNYVVAQMSKLGAQVSITGSLIAQPFGGLSNARDWPQTQFIEGALYLLYVNAVPGGKSKSQQQYTFKCQWSWILIGTDLQSGEVGENRGDRFTADLTIFNNLQQASYPGFCQKQDYSADPVTGVISSVPSSGAFLPSSYESIVWTPPRAITKVAQSSGLNYGVAVVDVQTWEDINIAVA